MVYRKLTYYRKRKVVLSLHFHTSMKFGFIYENYPYTNCLIINIAFDRCRCLPGYEGDGHQCRPLRSCREDSYLCDRNAECFPNDATGEFSCKCKDGYIGDGITCTGKFLISQTHYTDLLRTCYSSRQ